MLNVPLKLSFLIIRHAIKQSILTISLYMYSLSLYMYSFSQFVIFTTQNLWCNIPATVCTHRIGTEIFSNGVTNYFDYSNCPRLFSLHSFRGSELANEKPTMIAIICKILYNCLIED